VEGRSSFPRTGREVSSRVFTKPVVEYATDAWLDAPFHAVLHRQDVAVGESGTERGDPNYPGVLPERRLHEALV